MTPQTLVLQKCVVKMATRELRSGDRERRLVMTKRLSIMTKRLRELSIVAEGGGWKKIDAAKIGITDNLKTTTPHVQGNARRS